MKKQLPIVKQQTLIPTVVETPEEFAKRICLAHGKSIEAILETGKILIEAKRSLNHGEWMKIFDEEMVPFEVGTAERLIKIARNEVILNSAIWPTLPTSWTTLYSLTKIPDLKKVLEEGKVHADMKGKDVRILIPGKPKKPKTFSTSDSEHRIYKFIRNEYQQWPKSIRKIRFKDAIESILGRICHD